MAVCITGMHRSGTSMVAHLLNLCGLYLGQPGDLIPPHPDNPEGFWEHAGIVALNNRLLGRLNARWDSPPIFRQGWEQSPAVQELLPDARKLVEPLMAHGNWGWKDPRMSLLAPFWRLVTPDLKLLICVRHPLEVAASLNVRDGYNGYNVHHGLSLWLAYNEALLADREVVVTHYDAYFHDPGAELARVLADLGIPTSPEVVASACSTVDAKLHHGRAGERELDAELVPARVREVYAQLCDRAGPIYESMRQSQPGRKGQDSFSPTPSMAYNEAARAARREAAMDRLTNIQFWIDWAVAEVIPQIGQLQQQIAQLNRQLAEAQQQQNDSFNKPIGQVLQQLADVVAKQQTQFQSLAERAHPVAPQTD